jgi:hypothetical protein
MLSMRKSLINLMRFLLSSPREQSRRSPIREQSCWSPSRTQSTPLPTPDQTQPKVTKNVRGKNQPHQRKMSSKVTKGKQPLKESANPKLPSAMTRSNPKFVMGKLMLTDDTLDKAGQACVDLHNYYINNYKSDQDIIVSYKDRHFLVGDDYFLISFSDLYDIFNLDALDISLMLCFTL